MTSVLSQKQIVVPAFKRYEISSLSDIKFFRSAHFFTLFTATLKLEHEKIQVFLANYKYTEYTNNLIDNNFKNNKNFIKLRSENILNKIGYLVNKDSNTLSMLYEYVDGSLFCFNSMNVIESKDSDHVEAIKLCFIVRLLNLLKKLSSNKIQIGYLLSGNIIYNQNSLFQFKIIEPFLFSICNPKEISSRALFGIMRTQEPYPNDFFMFVLIIMN